MSDQSPRVMVVDDQFENVEALIRDLSDRNPEWQVLGATTEDEAFALIDELKPDLVISDLVMASDESGMRILGRVRESDPLAMVIIITAFEKKLDRYRAFELGAYDCVQKNTPGVVAAEEIHFKANAALRTRKLALEEIDHQRQLEALGRYFDPAVAAALINDPDRLEMTSRVITVVFWDLRRFSWLSEILKAEPTLISEFLREYAEIAADVVFSAGGVLDKYIGDGVMALFGALASAEDDGAADALAAIQAALRFRDAVGGALEEWMPRWQLKTAHKISIGVGCGIHTGEALVGRVGSRLRDQYTALGSVVNLAARLQGEAGPGKILVSASTFERVRELVVAEQATTLTDIKNIPGTFDVFSVDGLAKT